MNEQYQELLQRVSRLLEAKNEQIQELQEKNEQLTQLIQSKGLQQPEDGEGAGQNIETLESENSLQIDELSSKIVQNQSSIIANTEQEHNIEDEEQRDQPVCDEPKYEAEQFDEEINGISFEFRVKDHNIPNFGDIAEEILNFKELDELLRLFGREQLQATIRALPEVFWLVDGPEGITSTLNEETSFNYNVLVDLLRYCRRITIFNIAAESFELADALELEFISKTSFERLLCLINGYAGEASTEFASLSTDPDRDVKYVEQVLENRNFAHLELSRSGDTDELLSRLGESGYKAEVNQSIIVISKASAQEEVNM